MRARVAPTVEAGEAVCWRCNQSIEPGAPWDLGHDDTDRTLYRARSTLIATAGDDHSSALGDVYHRPL